MGSCHKVHVLGHGLTSRRVINRDYGLSSASFGVDLKVPRRVAPYGVLHSGHKPPGTPSLARTLIQGVQVEKETRDKENTEITDFAVRQTNLPHRD